MSSNKIPNVPGIFSIFLKPILEMSKNLNIKNDIIINKRSLSQIISGIDWPINSSITISFGSLLLKTLIIFLKKIKEYIVMTVSIIINGWINE